MSFVAFDFETTGRSPRHDRIVSYATVTFIQSELGYSTLPPYHRLVDSGQKSSKGAERVHHITPKDLIDAPSTTEVLPDLLQRLSWFRANRVCVNEPNPPKVYLIGYNVIEYDMVMLRAECERCDCMPLYYEMLTHIGGIIDPFCFLPTHVPLGQKNLRSVAARYHVVEMGKAHNAVADALTAGWLCLAMQDAGIIPHDLADAATTCDGLWAHLRAR